MDKSLDIPSKREIKRISDEFINNHKESITVVVQMKQLMDDPTSIYRMLENAKIPVAHTTDPAKLYRVLRGKMTTWQDDYTNTVHYKWSPQ